MNDIERAISEISDIRSQLAASTRFRGYAPEAVAMLGIVSLVVVLAQTAWPARLAAGNLQIALVWGAVLLIGAATIAIEALARVHKQHGTMAGAMLRSTLYTTVPFAILCLTLALAVFVWAPDSAWILPGIWQMGIGCVAFASHAAMPRRIVRPAATYLALGALVTLFAAREGAISPIMAGGPFVIGHLWIAAILHKEGRYSR